MESSHKAETLTYLYDVSPAKTKERATNCRGYKIKYKSKLRDRVILLVKCHEDYSDPKGHFVTLDIKKIGDKHLNLTSRRLSVLRQPMKVNCSCPAQKFWGSAYNLNKAKTGIVRLNREKRQPNIRDPKRVNVVCKHVLAVKTHLAKQSIYKALTGNTYHTAINCEKDFLDSYHFEEVSIEDCKEVLLKQNINIPDLDEDNFEERLIIFGIVPVKD